MGKSRLTCEIPCAQRLFGSDQAVCRLCRSTAMEFQSKNFRLGIGLFLHAAYAAHVAARTAFTNEHPEVEQAQRNFLTVDLDFCFYSM